jgi:hypothetical protein
VSSPVAVNTNFYGHLRFLGITLSDLYGYSMPVANFLVKKEISLHMPVLIPQTTVNSTASNIQSRQCPNSISETGKMRRY